MMKKLILVLLMGSVAIMWAADDLPVGDFVRAIQNNNAQDVHQLLNRHPGLLMQEIAVEGGDLLNSFEYVLHRQANAVVPVFLPRMREQQQARQLITQNALDRLQNLINQGVDRAPNGVPRFWLSWRAHQASINDILQSVDEGFDEDVVG